MAECKTCKKEQEEKGKEPRKLERMPVEITQHKNFKRKGIPLSLCPYCDGDAMQLALDEHHTRIKRSNA